MARRPKSIAGREMKKLAAFAKALDKINAEWIQELGDEVLTEAKDLAPMGNTGKIYLSHKIEHTKDGFKVVVDTPYAYDLHEGKKQKGRQGIHKSKVKAHNREYKPKAKKWETQIFELETFKRDARGKRVSAGMGFGVETKIVTKQYITRVRAHTKTYKKGYKPMKMPDGNWATVNVNKKPKKKAWLQEAWKIVRRRQDPVTRKLLQKSLYIER